MVHGPDVGKGRIELLSALGSAAEMTNHHDLVTRIDEVIRVGAQLIEVRADGRKDIVPHALSAVEGAAWSASAPRLVPLDLSIEGGEGSGNIAAIVRLVRAAHGHDILLRHLVSSSPVIHSQRCAP
jgi:hypothetical protein